MTSVQWDSQWTWIFPSWLYNRMVFLSYDKDIFPVGYFKYISSITYLPMMVFCCPFCCYHLIMCLWPWQSFQSLFSLVFNFFYISLLPVLLLFHLALNCRLKSINYRINTFNLHTKKREILDFSQSGWPAPANWSHSKARGYLRAEGPRVHQHQLYGHLPLEIRLRPIRDWFSWPGEVWVCTIVGHRYF